VDWQSNKLKAANSSFEPGARNFCVLAVANFTRWGDIGLSMPKCDGVIFVDIDDFDHGVLDELGPKAVVMPCKMDRASVLDVTQDLSDYGFAGLQCVVTDWKANPIPRLREVDKLEIAHDFEIIQAQRFDPPEHFWLADYRGLTIGEWHDLEFEQGKRQAAALRDSEAEDIAAEPVVETDGPKRGMIGPDIQRVMDLMLLATQSSLILKRLRRDAEGVHSEA